MTREQRLEAILSEFHLVGEDVVRLRDGFVHRPPRHPYGKVATASFQIGYHRLKFCLAHGYLPDEVDHRDKNPLNNSLSNLRDVPLSVQHHNQHPRQGRHLPRGVYLRKDGRSKKYRAEVGIPGHGPKVNLGSFYTAEEASAAVEAKLLELYGEQYSQT